MNTKSEISRIISRSVAEWAASDGARKSAGGGPGGPDADGSEAITVRDGGTWQGGRVTYDHVISDVVQVVEAVGAGIMIVGGAWAFADYACSMVLTDSGPDAYRQLRRRLGRAILLGLEVLIVGDIVRTIIVSPTVESVAVLGMIVAIRIVLSFSLEVEVDGVWPWNLWRLTPTEGDPRPAGPPAPPH